MWFMDLGICRWSMLEAAVMMVLMLFSLIFSGSMAELKSPIIKQPSLGVALRMMLLGE